MFFKGLIIWFDLIRNAKHLKHSFKWNNLRLDTNQIRSSQLIRGCVMNFTALRQVCWCSAFFFFMMHSLTLPVGSLSLHCHCQIQYNKNRHMILKLIMSSKRDSNLMILYFVWPFKNQFRAPSWAQNLPYFQGWTLT